jgi:hypothetical protein
VHPVVPGAVTTVPQVPSAAPACFVQLPPQQSVALAQTSPSCLQKEGSEQSPPLQSFEQHSAASPHALPVVLHALLSGLQTPPPVPFGTHDPPQHSSLAPQAWLSATHCLFAQTPLLHEVVQHSVAAAHWVPGALHEPTGGGPQTFALQLALQHSPLVAHAEPSALHSGASARAPSMMTSMNEASLVMSGPSPPPSFDGAGLSDSLPHPA